MADENNSSPDYVPRFLYLDMDLVKSYSARMREGFVLEKIEGDEKLEEVSNSLRGKVIASILGFGGAELGAESTKTDAGSEYGESVKGLHHYHFDLLQEYLEDAEGDWYHDLGDIEADTPGVGEDRFLDDQFRNTASERDIIKIEGDLDIFDMESVENLMESFTWLLANQDEFDGIDMPTIDSDSQLAELPEEEQHEQLESYLKLIPEVIPDEYKETIFADLYPVEGDRKRSIRLTIAEDKLESSPIELVSNYQESIIPDCTLVGQVESITSEGSSEYDFDINHIGDMARVVDDLASEFGFKVSHPSISVKPIAIYR